MNVLLIPVHVIQALIALTLTGPTAVLVHQGTLEMEQLVKVD